MTLRTFIPKAKIVVILSLLTLVGCSQKYPHRIYIECENATFYENVWHQEYGYRKNGISCYNYTLDNPRKKLEQIYPCDFVVIHGKSYSCINNDWGNTVILNVKSTKEVIHIPKKNDLP